MFFALGAWREAEHQRSEERVVEVPTDLRQHREALNAPPGGGSGHKRSVS